MDDLREKVIRGMECMVQISGKGCKECKYTKECDGSIATMYAGTVQMTIDALSLLKAQEPVEPTEMINDFYPIGDPLRTEGWKCGKCGQRIAWDDNYCSKCGTEVKWVE